MILLTEKTILSWAVYLVIVIVIVVLAIIAIVITRGAIELLIMLLACHIIAVWMC